MPNTLTITGGPISFNATAQLSSANPITIQNGGILESTSAGVGTPFLTGRPITIGSGGGTMKVADGGAILMVTDVISGPGVLTTDGPGELRTHSVEHTFSKLLVKQGLYTAGHSTSLGYATSFGAIPATTTADAITIYGGAATRKAGGQNVALDPKQGVTLAEAGAIKDLRLDEFIRNHPEITGAFRRAAAASEDAFDAAIFGRGHGTAPG